MKKRLLIVLGSIFLCVIAVVTAYAAQAGSSEDPLVTKSYVDDKISQLLQVIGNNSSNTTATQPATTISQEERDKLKSEILAELEPLVNGGSDSTAGAVSGEGYVPVYATVGQVVLGGEGTEMILRSGKADVYITGVAGIVNATTGKELVNGNKAALNNIMIIPRADGRGFRVTEAAWFLIKGDYEIK